MDSILLIAIALLILKRIPAGKKLGKGAKAGICVGIAAVVALVFWAMFFRSGSAPQAHSACGALLFMMKEKEDIVLTLVRAGGDAST